MAAVIGAHEAAHDTIAARLQSRPSEPGAVFRALLAADFLYCRAMGAMLSEVPNPATRVRAPTANKAVRLCFDIMDR